MPDVLVVFALEIREIGIVHMFAGMSACERKEDVVDKCDRRRRTFNVEENAAYWRTPINPVHRGSVNESVAQADGFELCIDAALGIPGCPS